MKHELQVSLIMMKKSAHDASAPPRPNITHTGHSWALLSSSRLPAGCCLQWEWVSGNEMQSIDSVHGEWKCCMGQRACGWCTVTPPSEYIEYIWFYQIMLWFWNFISSSFLVGYAAWSWYAIIICHCVCVLHEIQVPSLFFMKTQSHH